MTQSGVTRSVKLNISDTYILTSSASTVTFSGTVVANVGWHLSVDGTYITKASSTGGNPGATTVTFTVAPNTNTAWTKTVINLECAYDTSVTDTITIYIAHPYSDVALGNGGVVYNTNITECYMKGNVSWYCIGYPSWATVSPMSGSRNDGRFTVKANSSGNDSGTITFAFSNGLPSVSLTITRKTL